MVVIYAEKSTLAKAIAGTLGAGKRIPLKDEPTVGHYEFQFRGEDAILCHGVGHLMQLVGAKSYGEQFEKWDMDVFPCVPDTFKIAPKSATVACARLVKSFLQKADWIINATDPDREGELIFSYVYQACGCTAPYKRAWIEDLTDAKIMKAFDNLIEPDQIISAQHNGTPNNLQMAGRARDIADWLIGNNLTVAATKKYGGHDTLLSVGRVQTPTLALVVEREKAIRNHVKTPFWRLLGTFTTAAGENFDAEYEEGKLTEKAAAEKLLAQCGDPIGTVKELETKHKTESAPLLYNTTQLQIAVSKKLGWDSDKTAKIMQQLYDAGIMSYPRTSTEHLTEAMIPEVTLTLQKIMRMPEYAQYALPAEQWAKFTNRHFDDAKVGSHTAVIPTVNVPENCSSLSEDQKQLYDLLVKSLLRTVYPKAEIDDTTVRIAVSDVSFKATGSVITNQGWYAVDAVPEKKKVLPALQVGDTLQAACELQEGETAPPKRYTEAELLAAMELAGQHIEDEETRTLMKLQKKGLGTDATRAPILKSLFEKEYLTRKGKSILPTEKGMFLIDTLPVDAIKSADMTGEWEMRLHQIAMGTESYDKFVREITETMQEWYAAIAQSAEQHFVSETDQNMICPMCKKPMRKTKSGYGCSGYSKDGDGCKFFIHNEIAGKKLSEADLLALVQKGRTGLIKGFTSKDGKKFDAYLVVDAETGKLTFDFRSAKEHEMFCPMCKKPMRKTKSGYGCSGYSKDGDSCKFFIFSEIAGKKITESQILMLLQNGRTGVIKGFHSKKDPEKTFDAALKVDQESGKVVFDFPNK